LRISNENFYRQASGATAVMLCALQGSAVRHGGKNADAIAQYLSEEEYHHPTTAV